MKAKRIETLKLVGIAVATGILIGALWKLNSDEPILVTGDQTTLSTSSQVIETAASVPKEWHKPDVPKTDAHKVSSESVNKFQRSAFKEQQVFCSQQFPPSQTDLDKHNMMFTPIKYGFFQHIKPQQVEGMYVYSKGDIVSDNLQRNGYWRGARARNILTQLMDAKKYGVYNPLFVDIGSHVGYISICMASHGYRTISIEPMKTTGFQYRSTLCKNQAVAHKIHFFNIGLGETDGECGIVSGDSNKGNGILKCKPHDIEYYKSSSNDGNTFEMVPVRRLDHVINEDIWVLKLDVEGLEHEVLKGSSDLLSNGRIYHIDVEIDDIQMGLDNLKQFLLLMKEHGFYCELLDKTLVTIADTVADMVPPLGNQDIFCSNKKLLRALDRNMK